MNHKHILIAVAVGGIVGFVLANAPSGTGIYGSFMGQTLSNIYTAGNNASSGGSSAS